MAAGRKITVEFLGNDKTLGSTADQVEGKFGKLGGKLSKFGAVAKTGLLAAGVGAAAAGVYFFKTGAQLEQMAQKADTVFGKSLPTVEKWADRTAHAMGLTTREATGLAANFGDLLIPMGFTRDQAAKMSTDVVGLSGALSQWSGGTKSAAEVTDILSAAMLGETDGLKSLGISISAADVEARLAAKGQKELTGAAKQQAEAQAIQALIMEKSTDAQAAFAKGGSPLLSAQAKIKATLGELRDEIAVRLLPVMSSVASWVVDKALPAFKRFGGELRDKLAPVVSRIKEGFSGLKEKLQPVGDWFAAHPEVIKGIAIALGVAAVAMGALAVAAGVVAVATSPITLTVLAIAALGAAIAYAYKHSETFRNVVQGLGAKLQEFAGWVQAKVVPAVVSLAQKVGAKLKPIFEQLVTTFQTRVLPTLRKLLAKFEEWRPTIQRVIMVVAKIIGKVIEFAATILGKVLPPVIRFAGWLLGKLVPAVATVIGWVVKIIGKVIEFGAKIVGAVSKVAQFVSGLKSKFGEAVAFVKGIPGKIMSAIGDLGSLLKGVGKAIIQGLIDGIGDMVGSLQDKLGAVTKLIPDWKGPIDKDRILLRPAGIAIMRGLIDGIESQKSKLTTVLSKVTGFIAKMNDKIKDLLSKRNDVISSFKGFSQSVFGQDLSNQETGAPPTVSALLAYQAEQKAKAQKLRDDVRKLTKLGLSKSLIQQMVSSGESGIAQIGALASGSRADVKQLNALNAGTQTLLGQAGMSAGTALFGDDIAKARKDKAAAVAIANELRKLLKEQTSKTVVEVILDGRVIHTSLVKLKKTKGANLGLA